MASPKDTGTATDFHKILEQFKVPGIDMTPIIESRRKDMDALMEANKTTYEAMQAMAQKQGEILRGAMQGIQTSAMSLKPGAPDYAKQTELARATYEKALSDMKDLAEIARKAQVDAMSTVAKRATASVEEMKKLMQPK